MDDPIIYVDKEANASPYLVISSIDATRMSIARQRRAGWIRIIRILLWFITLLAVAFVYWASKRGLLI